MRPIRKHRRSAFTLIEMLIAIALGSSVMITAVALLHKVFELQSNAKHRAQFDLALDRFVEQFRTDVYSAKDIDELQPAGLLLELVGGDQVSYQLAERRLARTQILPDAPHQHVEEIELARQTTAAFDVSSETQQVALQILQELSPDEMRVLRRIEVKLGRFVLREAQSKTAERSSNGDPS